MAGPLSRSAGPVDLQSVTGSPWTSEAGSLETTFHVHPSRFGKKRCAGKNSGVVDSCRTTWANMVQRNNCLAKDPSETTFILHYSAGPGRKKEPLAWKQTGLVPTNDNKEPHSPGERRTEGCDLRQQAYYKPALASTASFSQAELAWAGPRWIGVG